MVELEKGGNMTEAQTTRGPYRKGIKRRREIVQAAARVFANYGYHGGSLRHIADEVGTTNATLIGHFGSKEGLLIAVLEHWQAEAWNPSGFTPGGSHFRGMISLMRYHLDHRGYLELFLTLATEASVPEHPAREFIARRYRETVKNLSGDLRRGCDAGQFLPMTDPEIEQEARSLVAFMDGIELQWLLDSDVDLVGLFIRQINVLIARWSGNDLDSVSRETDEWLKAFDRQTATV